MILLFAALLAVSGTTIATPPVPNAAPPNHAEVLAAVRSEWARYDGGGKGWLTRLEFGTWVMRAHGATVAPRPNGRGVPVVSAMNASSLAFARADANHDGGVTPEEMTLFLMRPASF